MVHMEQTALFIQALGPVLDRQELDTRILNLMLVDPTLSMLLQKLFSQTRATPLLSLGHSMRMVV